MKSKEVILKVSATAFAALAVFLFFRLVYPYHLHYHEQCQMFLFSSDYLRSVISIPGGFSDYISRFLIQFFYQAGLGAMIITALTVGVQLLTFAVCSRRTLAQYALSFLPAGILVVYLCDENALLSPYVAVILGLSFTFILNSIKAGGARFAVTLALEIVLYLLCGNIAVLVFLAVAVCREKDWKLALAGAALSVALAYGASHIFNYPFTRLMFGTHYHRYHNVEPLWPWASAVAVALIVALDSFAKSGWRHQILKASAAYAACLGLTAAGVAVFHDPQKEEMMKYTFYTRMGMWNRIINCAVKKSPDIPMTVSCLNLALAMTDQMGEHMFEFYQNGTDGLFPPYQRDHVSPIPTSDIYWHLGFVNTSQRFSFAAQEVIPDFQKSARCHQRMVEASLVNGAYDVARKYLEPLKYTIFYRKWALGMEKLLDAPSLIDKHPVYGRERAIMLHDHDFMYSDYEMDSMLGLHYVENPTNRVAMQYLLAWTLLNKKLQRFYDCFQLYQGRAAKSYQEGIILYWAETHGGPEGMPSYITEAVYKRFVNFIADYRKHDKAYMEKNYGDTYWYYYYYRSK